MRHYFLAPVGIFFLAGSMFAGIARAQSPPQDTPPPQTSAASPASADKPANSQPGATPKKVYTNEDLKAMPGDDVTVGRNSAAQRKPAGTGATKSEPHDQAYWHNRAENLRNQIADVDRQIAQITAGTKDSTPPDGSRNPITSSNPIYLNGQGARLRNLRARKAALEKQMDDLLEEARKANVPPGWLR